MLAEIQEANKAFGIIKNALQNGRELYDVSGSCATYFNCKSIIARRSKKKGKGSYLQNFMELEKLRKREEWIREWMIYAGRPNLYQDWLKFQSQCKKIRAAEARKKKLEDASVIRQVQSWFKWIGVSVSSLASLLVGIMEILDKVMES